ncbi:MAG: PEP/pyruvate-binding domain-containing protein, partial [Dehalococcoidales bacterium]
AVLGGREAQIEVLWLGQPECHDIAVVGAKAANLSRFAASHTVPPGFCLPATGGDWQERVSTSSPSLPPALSARLAEAYRRLSGLCRTADVSVAVRSSALDEDGSAASFAGQHDTYLNVVGEESVVAAIARCCASVNNVHAVEYRRRRGISEDNVKIAVLVQQMVPADISAVVFGANPVTGNRDEVVVNASWGLGESVVGGTVTPDSYVVRKQDATIISRSIGEKLRMTVPVPGGTSEVNVPRMLQTQPAASDEQVAEMARLAVELERTVGRPVDVECAYQGRRLHLLQCRPVTTLGAH